MIFPPFRLVRNVQLALAVLLPRERTYGQPAGQVDKDEARATRKRKPGNTDSTSFESPQHLANHNYRGVVNKWEVRLIPAGSPERET